eukprot:TRINITY_DN226_c0_g2_i1.p1 TRINITY_DN226_c0_g2~~TRINITY_DN226_c0_g2_i1.p1  ORF type:complete len:367 (+),score=36.66 TRINITY_DN226_c0_g2_i1:483-1583(+)
MDEPKYREEVAADLRCGVCKDVAREAQVTEECGHLFCKECIDRAKETSRECPLCRRKDYSLRPDHRANRQINEIPVKCCNENCDWEGKYAEYFTQHLKKCGFAPIECGYSCVGCGFTGVEGDVKHHAETSVGEHLRLLTKEFTAALVIQRARDAAMIAKLTEANENLEARLEKLEISRHAQLSTLHNDLSEIRRHVSCCHIGGEEPTISSPTWRQNSPKFEISSDCKTAYHSIPGWSTVLCTEGASSGLHEWRFQIGSKDNSEFIPSTVMVGVTSSTHNLSSTHLGNTPYSYCFQDNGFRWDGSQCYTYGQACAPGDTITVRLDFTECTISFSRNNDCFGVAFNNVRGLLFPAASMCDEGLCVTMH